MFDSDGFVAAMFTFLVAFAVFAGMSAFHLTFGIHAVVDEIDVIAHCVNGEGYTETFTGDLAEQGFSQD